MTGSGCHFPSEKSIERWNPRCVPCLVYVMRQRLTPSGLTRVVDRLVRRKLLRRVTVSVDKRGSAVAMTPHGFATYLRAKEVCDLALQSALADKLSGTQLRTLIRTLQPATTPSRT